MRSFQLPLAELTYRRLRDAARQATQPATAIARYAIESWLRQGRKAMLHEAIATYAAQMGSGRHRRSRGGAGAEARRRLQALADLA